MPKSKLKKRVRQRQLETGESYETALRHVRAQNAEHGKSMPTLTRREYDEGILELVATHAPPGTNARVIIANEEQVFVEIEEDIDEREVLRVRYAMEKALDLKRCWLLVKDGDRGHIDVSHDLERDGFHRLRVVRPTDSDAVNAARDREDRARERRRRVVDAMRRVVPERYEPHLQSFLDAEEVWLTLERDANPWDAQRWCREIEAESGEPVVRLFYMRGESLRDATREPFPDRTG